jgi:hippurate hydrolase
MVEVAGAENTLEFEPTMGAEDFSYFLQAKPGAYFVIGNGEGEHRRSYAGHDASGTGNLGPCTLHNPNYDFNDALIPKGAALWVRLAERFLAAG